MSNLRIKSLFMASLRVPESDSATAGRLAMLLVCSLMMGSCTSNSSDGTSSGQNDGSGTATASGGTLTYHNDNARTGQNLQETILTPANVNPTTFGKLFSYSVDGQVYGQPLYMPNVTINGQAHNVVFVVTMHNSVYAFDADNLLSAPLWKTSFSNPVPGIDYGCPDAGDEVGILSTPVIDSASGTLYVVAATKENGEYFYRLHALSVNTGTDKIGIGKVIEASVTGTGDGADVQGNISFDALQHWQRAALLLSNGVVYVGFGSHCDDFPFHGWLFSYDASSLALLNVFNAAPNGEDGGIWNGGPTSDADGNIFVITGNGTFDRSSSIIDITDWGSSFLRMTAGFTVLDFFTPFNEETLSELDIDLGSSAPVLLPDQSVGPPHLVVGAGKQGTIYLLNRDNMGKFNANDNSQIVQELTNELAGGVFGTPAYFQNTLYFAAVGDILKAFSLMNGHLSTTPVSQGSTPFGYPGASPVVSANGSINGIVWLIERADSAVLHAYLAEDLSNELYNSNMNPTRDMLGNAVKFTVPTVANGKVYVGTADQLSAFGGLP